MLCALPHFGNWPAAAFADGPLGELGLLVCGAFVQDCMDLSFELHTRHSPRQYVADQARGHIE